MYPSQSWSDVNIALRRFLHNHNIATERSLKTGLCPTPIKCLQRFFIVQSTIDSTTHSRRLHSLEHCKCTNPTTNIPPGRDSNPVPCVSSHNQTEWAFGVGQMMKYVIYTIISLFCIYILIDVISWSLVINTEHVLVNSIYLLDFAIIFMYHKYSGEGA